MTELEEIKKMCFKDKSYGVAQPGLLWFNRQASSQMIICRLSFASAEIRAERPPHMAQTHFCICTKHHEIGANGSLPEEKGEECSLREIRVCVYTQTHTHIHIHKYISQILSLPWTWETIQLQIEKDNLGFPIMINKNPNWKYIQF